VLRGCIVFLCIIYILFIIKSNQIYLNSWRSDNSLAKTIYKLNPEDTRIKLWYSRSLLEDGKINDCKEICSEIIKMKKINIKYKKMAYSLLMIESIKLKEYEAANKYCSLAGNVVSAYERGVLSLIQNNYLNAEKLFKKEYEQNNNNFDCLLGLSKVYLIKGMDKEYKSLIKNGLMYGSNNDEVQLSIAYGYFYDGNLKLAQKAINKCFEINKNNYEAYYLESEIYNKKEDLKNREKSLNKAINLDKLDIKINLNDMYFK
jgi:tetratricopeptide (TPR) repeat protein